MKDSVKVYEAGMSMFLLAVEKAIKAGYSLDLDVNEGVPQAYGSFYECTLYKDAENVANLSTNIGQVVDKTQENKEVKDATKAADVVGEALPETNTVAPVVTADAPSAIATARVGRVKKSNAAVAVVAPNASE